MSRRGTWQLVVALPYLLAALGLPAVELLRASTATQIAQIDSFHDDAFFYFEIASNLAQGLGSTFDGISKTNGYHPLWMALLVPVYALEDDTYGALILVTWMMSALWMLAIVCLYGVARELDAVAWFSPGLILFTYQRGLWFGGMETALLLTLLTAVSWRLVRARPLDADRPTLLRLGCWLAWLPMARLDAVLLIAVGALVFFSRSTGAPRERATRTALLVTPAAVTVGLLMTLSWILFGSALPVSARAKSLGAPFLNLDIVGGYLSSKPITAPGFEYLPIGGLLVLIVLPAWLLLAFGEKWIRPPWSGRRPLEAILGVLLLGQAAQLVYYTFASSWPLWRWYYHYTPLLLVFSLPVFVRTAMRLLPGTRAAALLLALLTTLALAVRIERYVEYVGSLHVAPDAGYKTASSIVARQLHATTSPTDVFAMGDRAGSLAYQLERLLIQTEGLVNSPEFLEALQSGTVHRFLQARGVDFYVYSGGEHSGGSPQPLASPAGCSRLVEPKFGRGPKFSTIVCDADLEIDLKLGAEDATGGGYWVWRYRPDLNPP